MSKPALVVRTIDFFDSLGVRPITTWSVMLANRDHCETDTSLLQIIPYVVVKNTKDQIFTYVRGQSGNESRLHTKLSIGVGGHVDTLPLTVDLLELLASEAAREILEETGITVDVQDIEQQIREKYTGICNYKDFIRVETTPVDMVHLGIPLTITVDDSTNVVAEANVVTNGSWRTESQLLELLDDPTVEIENWSKVLIRSFKSSI